MSFHRKTWITIGVAALALLLLLGAGAAWATKNSLQQKLAEEQAQAAVRAARLLGAKAMAAPAGESAPRRWTMSASADVAGTLQGLQQIGDSTGVVLASVKALPSTTPGRQSFLLAGSGGAREVCDFLAAIEQRERLVVIENGRVQANPDNQVAFDLGLVTFHATGVR